MFKTTVPVTIYVHGYQQSFSHGKPVFPLSFLTAPHPDVHTDQQTFSILQISISLLLPPKLETKSQISCDVTESAVHKEK